MYMFNLPAVQVLTASLVAGIVGLSGFLMTPIIVEKMTTVSIEPQQGTAVMGETFTIEVIVDSYSPVNVFKGLLRFDSARLQVSSIDYNTSIADLWAEEPWYSNGDGTISFIGGTTKLGGFKGNGTLLTVTFITKFTGEASINIEDVYILAHDGLGTSLPVSVPIDAVFAISPEQIQSETKLSVNVPGTTVTVLSVVPDTDLNDDGRQTVTDTSIFMTDIVTQNLRSDFNQDRVVNLKDLSILTQ
jgi:hypothetical protein